MSGAIQLTEVDFEQIKENLIDYLKSTRKFTDYDFAGSNLQVILNLISYQAQLNAYSTNMVANESFLASATLRNNVVSNSQMIGYTPTSARSSCLMMDFNIQLDELSYPQGFPKYVQVLGGAAFNASTSINSFIFNIIDTQTAAVNKFGKVFFKDIKTYEGVMLYKNFTVDNSDFNQKFIIENPQVDSTTIRVEVQEDPNEDVYYLYSAADNLVSLTEESKVYWLEETNDAYYQLVFGDGFFGKELRDGAKIKVSYLVTNAEVANGIQNVRNIAFVGGVFDSYGTRISEPVNLDKVEPSFGGSKIEDVSSIKFRAPKFYASQNRCVISDDYETIIRRIYPGVDDIYVYGGEQLPIAEYGRVYVVVKPTTGEKLSNISKTYIKNSLEPFRVASLDIILTDPTVVYVETVSTVFYNEKATNKDPAGITATVIDTLNKYSEGSTVSKFGGTVRYSRVVGAVDDSDQSITRNLTYLRMRRNVPIVENTFASYEICYENSFKLDCNNPVIYTTGFQMERGGIVSPITYYFEDDSSGKIRLFHFNEFNEKIIDDKEFGTVDYEKGEILIGYQSPIKLISTTETNSIIEVRALPRSQDVEAKLSIYLDFDVAKSEINTVVDTKIDRS